MQPVSGWRVFLEEERLDAAKLESLIELLGKGMIWTTIADEGALQILTGTIGNGNVVVASGSPGTLWPRGPHRSGRARLTHPALRGRRFACRSVAFQIVRTTTRGLGSG